MIYTILNISGYAILAAEMILLAIALKQAFTANPAYKNILNAIGILSILWIILHIIQNYVCEKYDVNPPQTATPGIIETVENEILLTTKTILIILNVGLAILAAAYAIYAINNYRHTKQQWSDHNEILIKDITTTVQQEIPLIIQEAKSSILSWEEIIDKYQTKIIEELKKAGYSETEILSKAELLRPSEQQINDYKKTIKGYITNFYTNN